jgi:hypothetical protein
MLLVYPAPLVELPLNVVVPDGIGTVTMNLLPWSRGLVQISVGTFNSHTSIKVFTSRLNARFHARYSSLRIRS